MHIAGFRNSARSLRRICSAACSPRSSLIMVFAGLTACGVPNDPNPPGSEKTNTYFTATQESSPKYLDPTSSYSSNETPFTYQIYEPLFRYHYLKRPYVLEGRAALSNAVAGPNVASISAQAVNASNGMINAPTPARTGTVAQVIAAVNADIAALPAAATLVFVRVITAPVTAADETHLLFTVTPL